MENFEMTSFEEQVADEMFPEVSNDSDYDSEIFLVKDRKHASTRRKKTYYKGKKRFTRFANDWGLDFIVGNQSALQGFMRKTNVKNPFKDGCCDTRLKTKRVNVRRQEIASSKMSEYVMED